MPKKSMSEQEVAAAEQAKKAAELAAKYAEVQRRYLKLDAKFGALATNRVVMNKEKLAEFWDSLTLYIESKQRYLSGTLNDFTVFDVGQGRRETMSEAALRASVSLGQASFSGNKY